MYWPNAPTGQTDGGPATVTRKIVFMLPLLLAACAPGQPQKAEEVQQDNPFERISSERQTPRLIRDRQTGCQYVGNGQAGWTPRLNEFGQPMCGSAGRGNQN